MSFLVNFPDSHEGTTEITKDGVFSLKEIGKIETTKIIQYMNWSSLYTRTEH